MMLKCVHVIYTDFLGHDPFSLSIDFQFHFSNSLDVTTRSPFLDPNDVMHIFLCDRRNFFCYIRIYFQEKS